VSPLSAYDCGDRDIGFTNVIRVSAPLASRYKRFNSSFMLIIIKLDVCPRREYAVALLVEALRYKPEGRVLDSRWVPSGRCVALSL
jgi:hypothetical protein